MFRNAYTQLILYRIDPVIISIVIILSIISFLIAMANFSTDYVLLATKTFHLLLALVVMLGVAFIPFHMILSMVPFFYIALVSVLLYVELFGAIGKGAKRWVEVGVLSGQPSEFAKGLVPLIFAYYFSNRPFRFAAKDVFVLAAILFTMVVLIARQPDFGTASFVFLIAAGCFFISGISLRYISSLVAICVISTPLLWFFYLSDYQKRRIEVFLNINQDNLDAGYHILQSKIAIGSGGLFGMGFGKGTQTQLNFIPEFHTDFVFASLSEDTGLVGALLLMSLYATLIYRLLISTYHLEHNSEKIYVSGVALILFLSCFYNIGMVIGILPVVGVPLPWLSYGGSSLLALAGSMGVAMGIVASHRRGSFSKRYTN